MQLNKSQLESIRSAIARRQKSQGTNYIFTSEEIREEAKKSNTFDSGKIADSLLSSMTSEIIINTESRQMTHNNQEESNSLANVPSQDLDRRIQSVATEFSITLSDIDIEIVSDIANQEKGVNFNSTEDFSDVEIYGYIDSYLRNRKSQTKLFLHRKAAKLRLDLANQTDEIQTQAMTDIAHIIKEDDDRMRNWASSIGKVFREATEKLKTEQSQN